MAGHASNWFKAGAGSVKGRVFVSNATLQAQYGPGLSKGELDQLKQSLATMAAGSRDGAENVQGLAALSPQPGGQAQKKVVVTVPVPAKPSPFATTIQAGAYPANLVSTKPSAGFDELAEIRTVMEWNGTTGVKKISATTEQVKRLYARRDAVKAAEAVKMKDGKTVREGFDAFFAGGGWSITGVLPGGRLRLSGPNDSELILKEVVAKNYAKVVLNYGDLARNY